MRLKEIEERLKKIKEELRTKGEELTEEAIEGLEKEIESLQEERKKIQDGIEKRQKLLERIADGEPTEPGGNAPTVLRSFNGAAETAEPEDKYASLTYRKAFMQYVCRGTAIPAEYRSDAISTTMDVGATIPTNVLNQIVEKLESTGMILPKITRTAYKGGVAIPVSTVKPTATWVNERAGSEKQKKNIVKEGMITFAYHKLRCAVAVSLEVDTMAIAAFETLLLNNIVEAMTKALEQAIINGDGVGKPKGILTETPEAGQKIESAKPSYEDLIAAEAALPMAYESGAEWCMSKKTFMQYYGITDTNGQPIGRVNYGIAGKPERTLLGRPVTCCDYIPSYSPTLEAGTVFAFLFNFKSYVLNTNYAMGIKKYEDNETDDQVTKSIMLADGKVVEKSSLVTINKIASV